MEPEGSLLCSQELVTGPYPDPDASSPHLPTLFSLESVNQNQSQLLCNWQQSAS
jgi:hypothetical protein